MLLLHHCRTLLIQRRREKKRAIEKRVRWIEPQPCQDGLKERLWGFFSEMLKLSFLLSPVLWLLALAFILFNLRPFINTPRNERARHAPVHTSDKPSGRPPDRWHPSVSVWAKHSLMGRERCHSSGGTPLAPPTLVRCQQSVHVTNKQLTLWRNILGSLRWISNQAVSLKHVSWTQPWAIRLFIVKAGFDNALFFIQQYLCLISP